MPKIFTNRHFLTTWLPPHLIALTGLWFVHDWKVFITFAIFYTLISGLGVAVGFHRYFSHKAFETSKFWQQAMLYFGGLSCQGNAIFWIALHVGLHHRFTDTDRDPHSPITNSIWTAYQGYSFDDSLASRVPLRAAARFLRHPEWMWSVNKYQTVLWGTWIAAATLSVVVGPWLLVGLCCAQVWAINQEAIVNLFGHKYGWGAYRSSDTKDHSVNRNWLGLITWGQSLHNSHHAGPQEPNFAFLKDGKHFEFDPSMLWINVIRSKKNGTSSQELQPR